MEPEEFTVHLTRLRRRGADDEHVEVKSRSGLTGKADGKSLWDSVSAFANTKGGHIFLGLTEPDFTPSKGFDAIIAAQAVHSGLNSADPAAQKVHPLPEYTLRTVEVNGAECVIVTIAPLSINGPCFVKNKGMAKGSYKRVDDGDRLLNSLEIYELQHRFDHLRTDREPVVEADRDDLDDDLISAVHRRLKDGNSRIIQGNGDAWLTRMGIISPDGVPTVAGLVALGKYPQQFFPRLFIDVAVHPGKEKSSPGTSVRFEDRRICDGNLLDMVRDTLQIIRKNLRTRRIVHDNAGYDVLEIPLEVLREALANAVMHRDYAPLAQDQSIAVDIYRDRLKITSPGGLPGGKSIDSLDDGMAVPRNPTLARLLMEVPWQGDDGGVLAESNGSGIPRMKSTMREAGLPIPDFTVDIAQVRVILHRFGLIDAEINSWLVGLLGENYDRMEAIALVLAKDLGAVTASNLKNHTGHDSGEMNLLLQGLAERSILTESDSGRFVLPGPLTDLSATQLEVLNHISFDTPTTIKELANISGRTPTSLRPVIRHLVSTGLITATAPPSSRNRAYLRTL
ncbi:ATP-binding protein [Corynebacterium pacaense]|uniref:ATP-binding protein n=1 Tax=Corynebacterium pacaense TaxID=1816684 RepID=UPI0009BA34F6|nr:ATP-binding protein [Corynebacterium pacaense]